MAKKIFSCQNQGIQGKHVEVEVDILQGLSQFSIVGLGDTAIQEAKERVRSAIKNSGANYPRQKKIINLAPAHLHKHGPHFDLPIAAGLLVASAQLNQKSLENSILAGELGLDGSIRPIKGVLTMALFAKKQGCTNFIIPTENVPEAQVVKGLHIIGISHLKELINYLNHGATPKPYISKPRPRKTKKQLTFDDISGNAAAKRALEIAAAGGHHAILTGPPGIGKTVLAKAFASILPPLTQRETLEVMQIHSSAGLLCQPTKNRPFRQVHPGCSPTALIGGGATAKPGEISLSHRGVLFLDELAEFPRNNLESLRQPLEEKEIHLARSGITITYPAQFTLIASMNPCPCGQYGSRRKLCICRPYQVIQYQKKLSGPLLDRIDLLVEVEQQNVRKYQQPSPTTHENTKKRVALARKIQAKRFKKLPITINGEMNVKQIQTFCPLTKKCEQFLREAGDRLALSGRQYYQTLKKARTIADLTQSTDIQQEHIAEALQYRHKT